MAGTEFDTNFGRRRFFYDTNTNLLSFHSPTNFIRIYREMYRILSLSFSSLRPLPMCISMYQYKQTNILEIPSPPSTPITISPYDSAYLINSTPLHSTPLYTSWSRNPSRDFLHTSIPVFAYKGMSNHLFVQKRLSDFSSPYIKCPSTYQAAASSLDLIPSSPPPSSSDLGLLYDTRPPAPRRLVSSSNPLRQSLSLLRGNTKLDPLNTSLK
ncbi:uncharacterized protein RSE6_12135 [Rhynchosporium secalis]|uniref:Uncharacterized protein n=1 Tax=Rhynchosporium secalis TaxID=38038 RepID=A0A1E1MPS2_RHYSE|nr:uncharacterized protein RSE6_12135 [Rhynchosporium secalis]